MCAGTSGLLGTAAFFRGTGLPAPWLEGSGAQPPRAVGGVGRLRVAQPVVFDAQEAAD